MRVIDRRRLEARLRDPSLVLVDVLPAVSWSEAHIPGALSLPVEDIPRRASAVLPDRRGEIVVYCGGPT
ncbi:MAG: rhodanese-like domain-containing protein [Candidatus Eisenbacteria bacterium]|nr:rhodanese-like domain-containing protein [Candidatus Eisenbacteria bacterium]MCC7141046.1 rhodanese-like domain-containing protein [Candidatus Eisenbacteria bacterium]